MRDDDKSGNLKTRSLKGWATHRPYLAVFAVTLAVCVVLMLFVDRPLALALKQMEQTHPDVIGFFRVVTEAGRAEIWYTLAVLGWLFSATFGAIAAFVPTSEYWRMRARQMLFMIAAMALSGIIVPLAKMGIGRLRPRYLFESGAYGLEPFSHSVGAVGFPSGHTQAIVSAATALCLIVPRHYLLYVVVAILVAASRVFVTAHFLSDVVMGAYVGCAIPLLLWRRMHATGWLAPVRHP